MENSGIAVKTWLVACAVPLALGGALLCPLHLAQAQLADSPWPKFQHDLRNTGRSPHVGPQDNTVKWVFSTDGWSPSPPVIATDRTIYFGVWLDNKFYALNPNGTLKWMFRAGWVNGSAVLGTDRVVYFATASQENNLYALRDDGDHVTVKWIFRANEPIFPSPTIGIDGTIYIGTNPRENKFYALRDENNNVVVKWFFQSDECIVLSPAVGLDGTIYVCSGENLYALRDDGSNVAIKWVFRSSGDRPSTPPVVGTNNTIYFATFYGKLYALHENGSVKWSLKIGEGTDSPIAINMDETIYVTQYDNDLNTFMYAISSDGTLKWSFQAEWGSISAPIVDADNTIYFASRRNLYALNSDGTLKWFYIAPGRFLSSPSISSDGTLYVAGEASDGHYALYAFGPVPIEQPAPDNTLLIAAGAVIAIIALFGIIFYLKRVRKVTGSK